jgi:hypothetical protein
MEALVEFEFTKRPPRRTPDNFLFQQFDVSTNHQIITRYRLVIAM